MSTVEDEQKRLQFQAMLLENPSLAFAREYIGEHDDVLIVGVGPGEDLRLLFKVTDGRILAIDKNPQMVAVAEAMVKENYADRPVTLRQMDMTKMTDVPDNSFDSTFERFVLLHATDKDRITAFGEMIRVTKPNGHIILHEPRLDTVEVDPPSDAFTLLNKTILRAFRNQGKNPNMLEATLGLARQFEALGNVELVGFKRHMVDVIGDNIALKAPHILVYKAPFARGEILRQNLIDDGDQYDRLFKEAQDHINLPGTLVMGGTVELAFKKK